MFNESQRSVDGLIMKLNEKTSSADAEGKGSYQKIKRKEEDDLLVLSAVDLLKQVREMTCFHFIEFSLNCLVVLCVEPAV